MEGEEGEGGGGGEGEGEGGRERERWGERERERRERERESVYFLWCVVSAHKECCCFFHQEHIASLYLKLDNKKDKLLKLY